MTEHTQPTTSCTLDSSSCNEDIDVVSCSADSAANEEDGDCKYHENSSAEDVCCLAVQRYEDGAKMLVSTRSKLNR